MVVAALIHYMGLLEMAAFHKMNEAKSSEEVLFVKSYFNQSNHL